MRIHNPEDPRPTTHRVEPGNIFLFHGSPGGSVLQLEELLRGRFPRTRFVRPALLHGDPEVTAEASLERLRDLEIPNGSAVIGISLGGLVAAKLQESGRDDLHVTCISSPTWVRKLDIPDGDILYVAARVAILAATWRWCQPHPPS